MKILKILAFLMAFALLAGCASQGGNPSEQAKYPVPENAVKIALSDEAVTVDGSAASTDPASAVYTANDIIYYESGKDFTYGEGG